MGTKQDMTPLTDAQRRLVAENAALAYHAYKKFHGRFTHLDDDGLLSACMTGLCVAARDYDPARARFSTHANFWMWHHAQRDDDEMRMIRVPSNHIHSVEFARRKAAGRRPAAIKALAMGRVESCRRRGRGRAETGIYAQPDRSPGPPELAAEREAEAATADRVNALLARLPEKHRAAVEAVVMRGETFAEAGRRLGVTRQAAQKYVRRGLDRLRAEVAS